jgi:predicted transposase YbfD/YdcC
MATETTLRLSSHFAALDDPRVERTKRHRLLDIVTIALCAVICGADNWVEIEEFGKAKEAWFATFLQLEHGIPSHDTFGRVFARLDPEQFGHCFLAWVQAIQHVLPLPPGQQEVIAFDGKALRRSHDRSAGKEAIYMVSAWATGRRLVLAQRQVDEKSNEITALPVLLRQLALAGCIVTIDAMGCQRAIARQIVEQGGDYVLALKGNQGTLAADVALMFTEGRATGFAGIAHDMHTTTEKDHGRLEIRRHWTIQDPAYIAYLNPTGHWAGLQGVGMVEAERRVGPQVSTESRYYILSQPFRARTFGDAVRSHWGVENRVHWILDVAFREDESRIRTDHSPANMALLRHMALNLLTQERTAKVGTKAKRLKAGWDPAYLLTVLQTK